jgi:flagellar P-ring protein precursor FlgI
VVINSRTGTIIIGNHVRVREAAVAHGNLVVTINENLETSQPNAFSDGTTTVTPQSNVSVDEQNARMFLLPAGITLAQLVKAVNAVGIAPGDLMAILEALKQSGALQAELVVI